MRNPNRLWPSENAKLHRFLSLLLAISLLTAGCTTISARSGESSTVPQPCPEFYSNPALECTFQTYTQDIPAKSERDPLNTQNRVDVPLYPGEIVGIKLVEGGFMHQAQIDSFEDTAEVIQSERDETDSITWFYLPPHVLKTVSYRIVLINPHDTVTKVEIIVVSQ